MNWLDAKCVQESVTSICSSASDVCLGNESEWCGSSLCWLLLLLLLLFFVIFVVFFVIVVVSVVLFVASVVFCCCCC